MVEAEDTFQQFSELIRRHTGLYLYDKEKLLRTVQARAASGGFAGKDAYYRYLLKGGDEKEWEQLMIQLTCGESHFFRDKGQLQLLRDRIIPELVEKHKDNKSLKIWCAGCSTGEEPYTVAILITELLQQHQDWRIVLIGSDINAASLHHAQQAIYRDWALRGTGDEHMRNHFHQHSHGWKLDKRIRRMVTFCQVDLMGDTFPRASSGLFDMDLIICRNVFIYYGQDAIDTMMQKFAATLGHGGYLLTGHAEVANPEKSGLKLRSFPESTIFQSVPAENRAMPETAKLHRRTLQMKEQQKSATLKRQTLSKPVPVVRRIPTSEPAITLSEIEKIFITGDYRKVAELLIAYLKLHPADLYATILQARCRANMGDADGAAQLCKNMIRKNPLCADAYYILAQLAQEHNHISEARALLHKAVYLLPGFLPAQMDLATLYQHEAELHQALRHWQVALRLVNELPEHSLIRHMEDVSVAELRTHLEAMIKRA